MSVKYDTIKIPSHDRCKQSDWSLDMTNNLVCIWKDRVGKNIGVGLKSTH